MSIEQYRNRECSKCGGLGSHKVINGAWLKRIRKQAGVKQIQIVEMCELSSSSFISGIENNDQLCPEKILKVYLELDKQNSGVNI